MSCDVGRSRSLDPMLLWLWRRPAAIALIRSLAWELLYAMGVALKIFKKKKKGTQVQYMLDNKAATSAGDILRACDLKGVSLCSI